MTKTIRYIKREHEEKVCEILDAKCRSFVVTRFNDNTDRIDIYGISKKDWFSVKFKLYRLCNICMSDRLLVRA